MSDPARCFYLFNVGLPGPWEHPQGKFHPRRHWGTPPGHLEPLVTSYRGYPAPWPEAEKLNQASPSPRPIAPNHRGQAAPGGLKLCLGYYRSPGTDGKLDPSKPPITHTGCCQPGSRVTARHVTPTDLAMLGPAGVEAAGGGACVSPVQALVSLHWLKGLPLQNKFSFRSEGFRMVPTDHEAPSAPRPG